MLNITDKPSKQRFAMGMMWLSVTAAIIILDGLGIIDIGKWGYGGLLTLVTLIIQFYFRRASKGEENNKTN